VIICALCLYHSLDRKIWDTRYGTVNIDTLEIGFYDFIDDEPCYKIHTEIKDGDTLNYYIYFDKGIYYRSIRDSVGRTGYVLYFPEQDTIDSYIRYVK